MCWIDDYLTYTKKNEAPEAFHLWSGLTAIAAVVRRNTWVDRGFYTIFPGQLMVVLVAGSAKMRKSTAIGIARDMLAQVPDIVILSGKNTPEALIDSLNLGSAKVNGSVGPRDSAVLIYASELSAWLSKQSYMEAMIPLLTDFADAPKERSFRSRGQGETVLRNICLTLLSASTPDWLSDAIPSNSARGGFMSRILYVYEDRSDRINPMPSKEDIDERLGMQLVLRLANMANISGQIGFSRDARAHFLDWYNAFMAKPEIDSENEGYWGRRQDHLLRVASLLSISREDKLAIEICDLEAADKMLLKIESQYSKAFRFIGGSAINKEQELVLRILRKHGSSLQKEELLSETWRKMDNSIAQAVIETLKSAGVIHEDVISGRSILTLKKDV